MSKRKIKVNIEKLINLNELIDARDTPLCIGRVSIAKPSNMFEYTQMMYNSIVDNRIVRLNLVDEQIENKIIEINKK